MGKSGDKLFQDPAQESFLPPGLVAQEALSSRSNPPASLKLEQSDCGACNLQVKPQGTRSNWAGPPQPLLLRGRSCACSLTVHPWPGTRTRAHAPKSLHRPCAVPNRAASSSAVSPTLWLLGEPTASTFQVNQLLTSVGKSNICVAVCFLHILPGWCCSGNSALHGLGRILCRYVQRLAPPS